MKGVTGIRRLIGAACLAAACAAIAACGKGDDKKDSAPIGKNIEFTNLRQAIHSDVSDPARRQALLTIVSSAESDMGRLNATYLKRREEFLKATANHKKDGDVLKGILDEWDREARFDRRVMVGHLFEMKGHMSDSEWKRLSVVFLESVTRSSDRVRALRRARSAQTTPAE